MKILQHGRKNPKDAVATLRFRCGSCGCVFEAENGEYQTTNCADEKSIIYFHSAICPECGKQSKEIVLLGGDA